jgi:hypothetical protein
MWRQIRPAGQFEPAEAVTGAVAVVASPSVDPDVVGAGSVGMLDISGGVDDAVDPVGPVVGAVVGAAGEVGASSPVEVGASGATSNCAPGSATPCRCRA